MEVVICAMPMAMASPLVVIMTHCERIIDPSDSQNNLPGGVILPLSQDIQTIKVRSRSKQQEAAGPDILLAGLGRDFVQSA